MDLAVYFALGIAALAFLLALYDRMRLEKRIGRLKHEIIEARRAIEERGLLAQEVAHEIRNPITAIVSAVDSLIMLIGRDIHSEHRRILEYIQEYSKDILHLVSDFLDISSFDAGVLTAHPKNLVVTKSIETVLGLLNGSACRRGVTLNLDTPKKVPLLCLDERHFKQVIFNLVQNAIKYGHDGVTVTVKLEVDDGQGLLFVHVEDNGPGMPNEILHKLFDPYFRYQQGAQLTKSKQEQAIGQGLGLALCKRLVELAHGTIEVHSALGQGTCFTIALPCEHLNMEAGSEVDEGVGAEQRI